MSTMDKSWYSKMGDKLASAKVQEKPDASSQWQSWEFADDMERGAARGSYVAMFEPASSTRTDNEVRLIIKKSTDGSTATLLDDDGTVHLMAKKSEDGCRFDIYPSRDGNAPLTAKPLFGKAAEAPTPAYALVASTAERKEWVLMSMTCDRCNALGMRRCGCGLHARIEQYTESVGPTGTAFCMDVQFPQMTSSGSREVVCEACGDSQKAVWCRELTSRRPKWNAKHKSLALDFRGRVTKASAKNFQLDNVASRASGKSLLLSGKVADGRYVLDYRAPLSILQAFACVVSTWHWH